MEIELILHRINDLDRTRAYNSALKDINNIKSKRKT
jgi:hypothetical protein